MYTSYYTHIKERKQHAHGNPAIITSTDSSAANITLPDYKHHGVRFYLVKLATHIHIAAMWLSYRLYHAKYHLRLYLATYNHCEQLNKLDAVLMKDAKCVP